MSKSNEFCITSEPDESVVFGASIAINDKYLAVGDTIANRVIIYIPDAHGKWIRNKIISPPINLIDSTLGEHSPVFGKQLELDRDTLIIEASKMHPIASDSYGRQRLKNIAAAYIPKRYLIRLDTETEVSEIELLRKKIDNIIEFNLLRNGKIEKIVIPSNGEERFGEGAGQLCKNKSITRLKEYHSNKHICVLRLVGPDRCSIALQIFLIGDNMFDSRLYSPRSNGADSF